MHTSPDPTAWLGITPPTPPQVRTLGAEETLFRQGDPVVSLFHVTAGTLRLTRHTEDGSRVLMHTVRAGDTLAEPSLFAATYHCDAIAATAARVHAFPRAAVLAAMAADPALALRFAGHLAHQIRDLRAQLELRDIRSAKDRLLAWLWLRASGDPPVARIDQDWTTIADGIGLRREVVYRTLAALERANRIRRDGDQVHLTPHA